MEPVREYLKENRLLFDGGMGTYYLSRFPGGDPRCELQNLEHPERVSQIHQEYRNAGARALKTNTFAANSAGLDCEFETVKAVLEAGYRLAADAAGEEAFVFADIGPAEEPSELCAIAEVFLELGASNFLFETFPDSEGLSEVCRLIRSKKPEAFIITSFAAAPDGFTRKGMPVVRLLQEMEKESAVDAVGLNCVSGPAHLLKLMEGFPAFKKPFSVMPNSGYPTMVAGRTYFESSADYFAGCMARIAGRGASILGGCCGTTPLYIARTAALLPQANPEKRAQGSAVLSGEKPAGEPGMLEQKLLAGKKVIAVELDPPVDADGRFFMESAARLKNLGVDAITIADCPVARVRADSSMLAAKLHRELGIDPIPHMTCRDRNLNASKALLLGLGMEGVRSLLVVTGDPLPAAGREEVKAVFNFNSAMLAGYARALGEELGIPFLIAGALNVNAVNFDAELQKALRKKEQGVRMLMTQPIFTEEAAENLHRAKKETGMWILGGLLPAVSYRNACYMQNEISGIRLSEDILEQYRLAPDRESAGRLGVRLSLQMAERIAGDVDGYYLMTPFKRIDLVEEIVRGILQRRLENEMEEKFLTLDDLFPEMFDRFERIQQVNLVWRTVEGEQKLVPEPFTDDWSLEERRFLVNCLKETLAEGGAACCIYDAEKIAGFFVMTRPAFGSRGQYADLQSLHVGRSYRRCGLGKRLLELAARTAAGWGREKLYISAHSAMESQAFYRAMGCRDAEEKNPVHVAAEPYDIQMEYPIPEEYQKADKKAPC